MLAGSRLSFRVLSELLGSRHPLRKKVLIYGAGDGGELFLREMRKNPDLKADVVGFLDDDRSRVKTKIHGIPILGDSWSAEFWVRKHPIDRIVISSPKIAASKVAELQRLCEELDVELVRASMTFERLAG